MSAIAGLMKEMGSSQRWDISALMSFSTSHLGRLLQKVTLQRNGTFLVTSSCEGVQFIIYLDQIQMLFSIKSDENHVPERAGRM
jgi:hypothetical protein